MKKRVAVIVLLVSLLAFASVTLASPIATGDVNGNGSVDISDALLTLKAIVGVSNLNSAQLAAADISPIVNGRAMGGKGKVTIADALLILKKTVKMLDWEPASSVKPFMEKIFDRDGDNTYISVSNLSPLSGGGVMMTGVDKKDAWFARTDDTGTIMWQKYAPVVTTGFAGAVTTPLSIFTQDDQTVFFGIQTVGLNSVQPMLISVDSGSGWANKTIYLTSPDCQMNLKNAIPGGFGSTLMLGECSKDPLPSSILFVNFDKNNVAVGTKIFADFKSFTVADDALTTIANGRQMIVAEAKSTIDSVSSIAVIQISNDVVVQASQLKLADPTHRFHAVTSVTNPDTGVTYIAGYIFRTGFREPAVMTLNGTTASLMTLTGSKGYFTDITLCPEGTFDAAGIQDDGGTFFFDIDDNVPATRTCTMTKNASDIPLVMKTNANGVYIGGLSYGSTNTAGLLGVLPPEFLGDECQTTSASVDIEAVTVENLELRRADVPINVNFQNDPLYISDLYTEN